MKGKIWISIILIPIFSFGKINISQAQGVTPCNFNGAPVACPSGVPDGSLASDGGMAPFPSVIFFDPVGGMTFPVFGYTPMAFMAAMSSMMSQAMESMMGPNTAQSQANVTNSVTGSLNQQPTIPNPTQNLFTVFSEVPADKRVVLARATNTLLTDLDYEFRGNGEPIADTPTNGDPAKDERLARLNRNRDLFDKAFHPKGLPAGQGASDSQTSDGEDGKGGGAQDSSKGNSLDPPIKLKHDLGEKNQKTFEETNPLGKLVEDVLTGEDGVFKGITKLFQAAKAGTRFLVQDSIEEELEEDIEDLEHKVGRDEFLINKAKRELQDRLNGLRKARAVADAAKSPGNKLRARQDVDEAQKAVDDARDTIEAREQGLEATQKELEQANRRLEAFEKQVGDKAINELQKATDSLTPSSGFLGLPKQAKDESFEQFKIPQGFGLEFPSKEKGDAELFPPGGQVEQNVPGTGDGTGDFQQAKVDLLGGDDEGFTAPDKTQESITDKLEPLRLSSLKQSDRAQAAFKRVFDATHKFDEARLKQRSLALDVERAIREQKAIKQEAPSTAKTLRLQNANQAVSDARAALVEGGREVEKLKKEYEVLSDIAAKENAASKEASDAYFTASAIESGKILLKSLGVDPEQNSPTLKSGPSEEEIFTFQNDPNNNQWLKRARDRWDDSFGRIFGGAPKFQTVKPPFFEPFKESLEKKTPSTFPAPSSVEQSFGGTDNEFAGPGIGFDQLGADAGDFVSESPVQGQPTEQSLTPEQQEKIQRLQIMEKKFALALAGGSLESEAPDKKIKEIREALDILQGKPIIANLGIFEKGRSRALSDQELKKQKENFVEVPSDFARDVGVDFGEGEGSKAVKDAPKETPKKTEVAKETFQEVPSDFLKDIGVEFPKGLTTTPSSGQNPTESFDTGNFDQTGADFSGPGTGQDLLGAAGDGFQAPDPNGEPTQVVQDAEKNLQDLEKKHKILLKQKPTIVDEYTQASKEFSDAVDNRSKARKAEVALSDAKDAYTEGRTTPAEKIGGFLLKEFHKAKDARDEAWNTLGGKQEEFDKIRDRFRVANDKLGDLEDAEREIQQAKSRLAEAQGSGQGDNQRAEGSSTDSSSSDQRQRGRGPLDGQGSQPSVFQDLQAQDARNAAPVQPINSSNSGTNQPQIGLGGIFTSPPNRPQVSIQTPDGAPIDSVDRWFPFRVTVEMLLDPNASSPPPDTIKVKVKNQHGTETIELTQTGHIGGDADVGVKGGVIYQSAVLGGQGKEISNLPYVENGGTLVVEYTDEDGDVIVLTTFRVYDTISQHELGRVKRGLLEARRFYNQTLGQLDDAIADPTTRDQVKDVIQKKLGLVDRIEQALNSEHIYLDTTRVAIARRLVPILFSNPDHWDFKDYGGRYEPGVGLGDIPFSNFEREQLGYAMKEAENLKSDQLWEGGTGAFIGGYRLFTHMTGGAALWTITTGSNEVGQEVGLGGRLLAGVQLGVMTGIGIYASHVVKQGLGEVARSQSLRTVRIRQGNINSARVGRGGNLVREPFMFQQGQTTLPSAGSAAIQTGVQSSTSYRLIAHHGKVGGREVITVATPNGPKAFYRRTGRGGDNQGGAQAGDWAPFDGFSSKEGAFAYNEKFYSVTEGQFVKHRYAGSRDDPLYRFGNEENIGISKWLNTQEMPGVRLARPWQKVQAELESMGVETIDPIPVYVGADAGG